MRYLLRVAGTLMPAAMIAIVLLVRHGAQPTALAAQPATAADTDLALVPADAVGFIHVRAAELWKSDLFAGFRQTFEKAGPKALATLDSQFVPKISTFERATGFLLLDERQRPLPYLVLRFTADFKPDDVAKAYLPTAEKTNHAGKTIYHGDRGDFDLYFPDNRHIVVSPPEAMMQLLKHEYQKTGPLSDGLALARSGKPVVVSVNVAALPIPPKELESLPPAVKPLLKARHVTASLDVAGAVTINVVAGYADAAAATEAEKAVKGLADFARKELANLKADLEKKMFDPKAQGPRPLEQLPEAVFSVFALGAINHADELLADPGKFIKRSGSELTASLTLPKELFAGASSIAALGAAMVTPAVAKVRMAAARMTSSNNLKQIALAIHNYESAYGHLPHDIVDKNGKPILSWRVAILPFIEQDNLYKQFKLDEPWDSDNNKKWSEVAIKVYMSPQADPPTPPGMTHYKAFSGPGAIFETGKKIKFGDITDGTSNTLLLIEGGEAVPWAKPGDVPFDPKKPLPKLALPGVADFVNVAMADGSVRTIKLTGLTEKTLKAMITRSGGEIIADDPVPVKK